MLRGHVNEHGEPIVHIKLILGKKQLRLPVVVDTGFNGYLSVPKFLIAQSRWEWMGFENYELASGAVVREEVYWGQIVFDRKRTEVYIVATDSADVLLGTRLLRRKQLWIDFGSGEVRITAGRRSLHGDSYSRRS
jgi:clan AA aspartic protease